MQTVLFVYTVPSWQLYLACQMEVPGSIFQMGFSLMEKKEGPAKTFASISSSTQMVQPRHLKAIVHFNVDFAKH